MPVKEKGGIMNEETKDHGAPFGYFQTKQIKLAGKGNKGEIQLLRVGKFHHPKYGVFEITSDILATMVRNFKEVKPKPPTELVVDYEHQSTIPDIIATAAGWVEDVYIKAKGLFAKVRWTDEAAELIKADKYRFISPQFDLNDSDKETGKEIGACLLSVALTNRPFLDGMIPVVLCESQEGAEILLSEIIGDGNDTITHTPELLVLSEDEESIASNGDEDIQGKGDQQMERELKEILGIKEGDVIASVVALKERAGKAIEDEGRIEIAQLRVAQLEETIALSEKVEKETQAKALVDGALNAGKITPKLADWALGMALSNPESFATFLDSTTPMVDTKELGKDGGDSDVQLTDTERVIAAKMGLTDADIAAVKSKK